MCQILSSLGFDIIRHFIILEEFDLHMVQLNGKDCGNNRKLAVTFHRTWWFGFRWEWTMVFRGYEVLGC